MIIKPNLLKDSYLKNPKFWKVGENFKSNLNVVTIMYNEPIDYGLILSCVSVLKPDTDYTLSIEVKGTREFKLNYNYFMDSKRGNYPLPTLTGMLSPSIWHKISLPYKYLERIASNTRYHEIMVGVNLREVKNFELIEISFKNPKLIEGTDTNIYTPSINDLEPSKQAVFVAGGYSRKCTHSKLKTSRNRPVKFGGALC